eukprot:5291996-Amphidinium_carterae.1
MEPSLKASPPELADEAIMPCSTSLVKASPPPTRSTLSMLAFTISCTFSSVALRLRLLSTTTFDRTSRQARSAKHAKLEMAP